MQGPAKPLLYALLLSFLIHFVILFGTTIELPDWAPTPQLTVELQAPPPKPAAPISKPTPKPRPQPREPAPPPTAPVLATPEPAPEPDPVLTAPEPTPAPIPPEPLPTPPPPPPNIAAQRAFPSQVEVVYTVHRGDQGMRLGRTTHKWHIAKNQYLLTSTTEATGFISLFYSGRYIMTSKGELTTEGLQPASFWIQRGQSNDRTESAEFNWEANTLDYGKGTERHNASINPGTQDQLSVFYQLALTAPHTSGLRFALTTGRKLNQYTYQVAGEETLDTALGKLKTQRLSRVTGKVDSNEGSDIWLAIDYHYLPVRFRLGTRDGEVLDHWIAELRVEGKRVETKVEEAGQ
jgi:hypothetical protein